MNTMAMKILRNFDQNFFDLLKDAHTWEYSQINDNKERQAERKPKLYFTPAQWFLIALAAVCVVLCPKGIDANFAGYIISGLSLFAGILFSLAVSLFDKFNNVNFTQYKESVNADLYPLGARLKNYFKKSIILTLYTAILAIGCILMLALIYMFDGLQNSIDIVSIVKNWCQYDCRFILKAGFISVFRLVLFYMLLNFIYITKQMITSFYDYMVNEINKIKLK